MVTSDERRGSAAVAQADNEDAVEIDEGIFAERIEGRSVTAQFAQEVGFAAVASAFATARFVHPRCGETRGFDDAPEDGTEAVGFAARILDAVAAEPADKENNRHFAGSIFGAGDKGAELISLRIANPVVNHRGVLEMFSWT